VIYGLDFGYTTDPTALIKVGKLGEKRFVQELVYQKGLLIGDLAKLMRQEGVKNGDAVICDSARPDLIAELRLHGFSALGVTKPKVADSVIKMLELSIFVHYASANILHEQSWYSWRLDKNEQPTNEPIDSNNHAMDAIRYTETMKDA
jgi:phage terminase large subunit